MNTCKNCKWWGTDYEGVCSLIDSSFSYPGGRQTPPKPDSAQVSYSSDDDSGAQAHLVTGPDFGCVRFTQKPL